MSLYRIYKIIGFNLWEIMEVPESSTEEVKYRQDELFHTDIKLLNDAPLGVQAVWTEQPSALAAFSQALMLFGGEIT